jgi:hypothetical protein
MDSLSINVHSNLAIIILGKMQLAEKTELTRLPVWGKKATSQHLDLYSGARVGTGTKFSRTLDIKSAAHRSFLDWSKLDVPSHRWKGRKKTEELQSIPEESNTLMLHEEAVWEDLHALSLVILLTPFLTEGGLRWPCQFGKQPRPSLVSNSESLWEGKGHVTDLRTFHEATLLRLKVRDQTRQPCQHPPIHITWVTFQYLLLSLKPNKSFSHCSWLWISTDHHLVFDMPEVLKTYK